MIEACPDYELQPLGDHHSRGAFSCGHDEIDLFIRERALADHNAGKVRIHAGILSGTNNLIGFYSLVISAVAPKSIPGALKRTFGNRAIPAVYLAGIGVDQSVANRGLGGKLMLRVFEHAAAISNIAGVACITLDAVDEDRAKWYEGLQFTRFAETPDGKISMFIAMSTVRDALSY